MDILSGLQIQIDTLYYNLLLSIAGLQWGFLKGLIMMGYNIELLNKWLGGAFISLIDLTNDGVKSVFNLAFVIALLVLGITYSLAAFVRLDVVRPRSAFGWYLAGILFFAIGPTFYSGMNELRMRVAEAFYLSTLDGLQSQMGGAFNSLEQVESSDLPILGLCDNLGVYLPEVTGPGRIDGLDVTLAYLRADGPDVMGYPQPLPSPGCPVHLLNPLTGSYTSQTPQEWYFDNSYFEAQTSPMNFDEMEDEARAASISMASSSQGRLLTAWPLALFGVVEQLVYLLITVAQGMTFISFGVAVLFAFFRRTEVIARSIVDQWIELIVLTVIVAVIQSLVVAFFLVGAASGNGVVVLGTGLICLIFMVMVLWSGVKALWNSMNRLFGAMGQVTGGSVVMPGAAAGTVVSGAAAALTGGASLMGSTVNLAASAYAGKLALDHGATGMQAAGITLGGSQTLTSLARSIATLPGLRDTSLGTAAEEFTEGAVVRRVAETVPLVGAAAPILGVGLLSNRQPSAAEYDDEGHLLRRPMLVPAVGSIMDGLVGSKRAARRGQDEFIEDEEGNLIPLPASGSRRPARTGMFTPTEPLPFDSISQPDFPPHNRSADQTADRQQTIYAQEMQGEELEQHLSEVMWTAGSRTAAGTLSEGSGSHPVAGLIGEGSRSDQAAARLEAAADALLQAARVQGQLHVSGGGSIASVLGDVIRLTQAERGAAVTGGMNYPETGLQMARVMGIEPVPGHPPVQENLSRFGFFTNQALQAGLSGDQAEQVVREVKTSPEGRLTDATRADLVQQQVERGLSWDGAQERVSLLEHSARILPDDIHASGMMTIPRPAGETTVASSTAVTVDPGLAAAGTVTVLPTAPPEIKVEPQVQITLPASTSSGGSTGTHYGEIMRQQAAMEGSQDTGMTKGVEE